METTAVLWRRTRTALLPHTSARVRPGVVVAALLAIEVLLFSASWPEFFCGDGIFYLARIVEPAQLPYLFTHMNSQGAYRPLGYLLNSFVLYPLFGLNPLGYHVAMLAMHLLVCLLAYRLFRAVLAEGAALAALLFFTLHAVHFYATFDTAFLPGVTMMLCWLGALLCYERYEGTGRARWLAGGLLCFLAGLLNKETIVMLPATLVMWDALLRRRAAPQWRLLDWRKARFAVLPFVLLDALYFAWIIRIKHGLIYPGGIYGVTLRPEDLARKREYLFWLANLPTDFERGAALSLPAAVLMLPVAAWAWWRLCRAWRRRQMELLACAAWAAAAIAPVLVVRQQPMPHHLDMPLVATSLALGFALQPVRSSDFAPIVRRHAWILPPLLLAVALQVQWNLRYSWAGEGARITKASLDAVQRAYPSLPHASLLYVLPTTVRGTVAWYFDNGNLFRVFYRDPSLRTAYADHGDTLPADFARRPGVFIFRFHNLRLFDATVEYKADHAEGAIPLLPRGGPIVVRQEVAREALVTAAGAEVRLPVPLIEPGTVLQVGATPAGVHNAGALGRVYFESGGRRELVTSMALDSFDQGDEWWDVDVPMERWAGRSGFLVLSAVSDLDLEPMAWSRLRLLPAHVRINGPTLPGARRYGPSPRHLASAFDDGFTTASPAAFRKPTLAFLRFVRTGGIGRVALITVAGAAVRFPIERVRAGERLLFSLAPALSLGDGMVASVWAEQDSGRRLLFQASVAPRQGAWREVSVPLAALAPGPATLVLECAPGPANDPTGDWLAWGRPRIE